MEMEFTNGKMEESMLVVISWIKKVDTANIIGMMDGYLKDYGKMEKEMGKAE